MGRRLTASEETALLRETIREAHEATQALRDAIKDAGLLAPRLVADFEATHHREISQLSNYFTEESNRASADLNTAIEAAREMISNQLMSGKAVFDRHTSTVTISWSGGAFDSNVPLPFPHEATWKVTQ
ncbi:MAG: hypothetical protein ACRD45_22810 [Bryobacteraceae bacterium]